MRRILKHRLAIGMVLLTVLLLFVAVPINLSAATIEGLNWEKEPGIRIDGSSYYQVSTPAVVQLNDGSYRMYYSESPRVYYAYIVSAISTDGLNWVKESGRRLPSGWAPNVIVLPDGTYKMYYHLWLFFHLVDEKSFLFSRHSCGSRNPEISKCDFICIYLYWIPATRLCGHKFLVSRLRGNKPGFLLPQE